MFGRRKSKPAGAPVWAVERIEQATETLTCRIRTDPAVAHARPSHRTLLWVTVPFLDTRSTGLPTADEAAGLDEVEGELERLVGDRGMLVVSVTGADVREYLIYTENGAWVDDLRRELADAIAPHSADVMVQEDRAWAGYRKYGG